MHLEKQPQQEKEEEQSHLKSDQNELGSRVVGAVLISCLISFTGWMFCSSINRIGNFTENPGLKTAVTRLFKAYLLNPAILQDILKDTS